MGLQLYLLYITTFLDLLATSLLVPFLPVHLHGYGLPRLVVGLITSVYPSVQLFSSPAIGFYSDRYGLKFTLIVSLLLCSLAYYLLASTTSVLIIFLCRVVLGVVKHTQTICKAAFLSHSEIFPETVGVGGLSAAEALGFMFGPVIGAHFIGGEDGFRYLCKITTTLFVVNAVVALIFLSPVKRVINYSTNKSEAVIQICKKSFFLDFISFWDILVLKFVLCFSLSLFYINYHVMVVEYLGMSPSMVGYTNSFQGLICIIASLISSKISVLYFLKRYYLKLSFCFLLLSSSFYFINLVSNSGTFVIYLIPLSCSSSLLRIYLTEALNHASSNNKTSIIGIENTIATVANLMSPFAFEFFSYLRGKSSVTYVAFIISGFGSLLSLALSFSKHEVRLGQ